MYRSSFMRGGRAPGEESPVAASVEGPDADAIAPKEGGWPGGRKEVTDEKKVGQKGGVPPKTFTLTRQLADELQEATEGGLSGGGLQRERRGPATGRQRVRRGSNGGNAGIKQLAGSEPARGRRY